MIILVEVRALALRKTKYRLAVFVGAVLWEITALAFTTPNSEIGL